MIYPSGFFRRRGWNGKTKTLAILLTVALLFFCSACSVKKLAVNSLANALTEGSAGVYATDDDPQLVGQALPFALKTIEILLQSAPEHKGLLLAAASGFVQYAHAYVLRPANSLEFTDVAAARKEKKRAKRLFLRAYQYGLRALEVSHRGITEILQEDAQKAVSGTTEEDVPALYWTGAALGSAVSVAKNDMALVGDLPIVEALMQRALHLDEAWGNGAIHEFFIIFYAGKPEAGSDAKAEAHFQRAMQLNEGKSISPLVTFAESVAVQKQDRRRFHSLVSRALEFDADQFPENRLANLLAQKKAGELLTNIDQYFFEEADFQDESAQNMSENQK